MKISLMLALLLFVLSPGAYGADKAEEKKQGLSTDMSFEDLLVQGKYHFSDEAVATVEEDKVLDALLGIRKDFKDRIKRSASRH
ncbi:MAG: hypothetical protein H6624_09855 [Bdellovibrionaceae bacterium]|nr:hypothetical protein [Bdellovibrionales bacterium]MCB9084641.1 hypothetical protein [Pseudobdellovibrionaceae bacterium]